MRTQNSNIELLVYNKLNYFFYFLLILFWLAQFSSTPYDIKTLYPFMRIISSIMMNADLIGHNITFFEIILYLIVMFLLFTFRSYYVYNKFFLRFYFFSVLIVIISFLNPNNSFDKLKYLITDEPRMLLFYLLFLYTFAFLRKDILAVLLKKTFNIGGYIVVLIAVYILINFILGNGIEYIGGKTTLPHAEILNSMIIFQGLFFLHYLIYKKNKFLYFSILMAFIVFLSSRRTPVFVMIIFNVILLFYVNKLNINKTFRIIISTVLILFAAVFTMKSLGIDIQYHFSRITSIINIDTGSNELNNEKYMDDAGHFTQTRETFSTMFHDIANRFWGAGMRNEMNYVEGQSGYIHNNFVVVWSIYGFHMSIFIFCVLFAFLRNSVLFFIKPLTKLNLFKVTVLSVFSLIIIGDAFTGEYFFKHYVYVTQFVLVLCIFKIDETNIEYILPSEKETLNSKK
ncbi:MAG: O-antigen ligase [Bacteroidales bacterium]|nr:O-antigen ligase [Bacteroidales bacterium]